MEEYRIILSPDLDITSEELVEIWNTTPECQEIGQITIGSASVAKQFDASITDIVLVVFGNVAIGVIAGLIVNAITKRKPTIVTESEQLEITHTKNKLKIKKTKITKKE